jgi:hypothetical protein
LTGDGINGLLVRLSDAFEEEKVTRDLTHGFDEGRQSSWLHEHGVVTAENQT